jgi:hypothetical protein
MIHVTLMPAPGRAVRDPLSLTLLPGAGARVAINSFWRRRLRDGDVSIVDEPTSSPALIVSSLPDDEELS